MVGPAPGKPARAAAYGAAAATCWLSPPSRPIESHSSWPAVTTRPPRPRTRRRARRGRCTRRLPTVVPPGQRGRRESGPPGAPGGVPGPRGALAANGPRADAGRLVGAGRPRLTGKGATPRCKERRVPRPGPGRRQLAEPPLRKAPMTDGAPRRPREARRHRAGQPSPGGRNDRAVDLRPSRRIAPWLPRGTGTTPGRRQSHTGRDSWPQLGGPGPETPHWLSPGKPAPFPPPAVAAACRGRQMGTPRVRRGRGLRDGRS